MNFTSPHFCSRFPSIKIKSVTVYDLTKSIRNKIILVALLLFSQNSFSQTLYLNNVEWLGYAYTCHGSNISLTVTITGTGAPDSCIWYDENYTELSRLFTYTAAPGSYYFTTIDNGYYQDYYLMVIEETAIGITDTVITYSLGVNVSTYGGNDGGIILDVVQGGLTPYSYSWSNSATTRNITNLTAGTYTVTVTDDNGCTKTLSRTLIQPPQPLTLDSVSAKKYIGGYNISVNGAFDGKIKPVVSGGSPPYTLNVNGLSLENDTVKGLMARQYSIVAKDAAGGTVSSTITLTEPSKLQVTLTGSTYTLNGQTFNLSCNDCANGNITSTVTGGVSPYRYLWSTGQTTANISGQPQGYYVLLVTDTNGAVIKEQFYLKAPEKNDWTLSGNGGTDSTTNFIGTTDAKPVIIKTNNTERIHIEKDGKIILKGKTLIEDLTVSNPLTLDTLRINRIMPQTGDTMIRIGTGSLHMTVSNNIFGTSPPYPSTINGIGVGSGCYSYGAGGLALGFNSIVSGNSGITLGSYSEATGAGSIIIGVGNNTSSRITNNITNAIMIGSKSTIPSITVLPGVSNATGLVGIGTTSPSELLTVSDGNIFIQGEGKGLIVDEGTNKRVGFMKYPGHEAGIWRTSSQKFEIGRVDVTNLSNIPGSFTTDFFINGSNGNVGIGTTTTGSKLTVAGNISSYIEADHSITVESQSAFKNLFTASNGAWAYSFGVDANGLGHIYSNTTPIVTYLDDGAVGINFDPSTITGRDLNYKLYVDGAIAAREVRVTANNFPDFVFEKDYQLLSLYELEKYIKENKHLPNIPSAATVESNNGYEVGSLIENILRLCEEQVLHIISLQKQIDELKFQVKQ